MNEPQILAQSVFLAGLYIYLRGDRRGWALELTALLFVLGGNIKHNMLEFPFAVLIDLLLTSPRRAARFAFALASMAALSFFLTIRVDGPAYLSCLLTPRSFSWKGSLVKAFCVLLPLLLPLAAALWTALYCRKNPAQRVLALLLMCALAIDTYFSGGSGVTINAHFGSLAAIVLLTGVFWTEFSRMPLGLVKFLPQALVCAVFFLWLAIPMVVAGDPLAFSGKWRTDRVLHKSRETEARFSTEIAFLRQQPGPALCEDLSDCYYAGKPYLYDPFNATRFIFLGRLDANVMVDRLRKREFGAIQMYASPEQKLKGRWPDAHFAPPILRAIQQYYRPDFQNEDGVIYLPRPQGQ
jgi:hypothetical protein